MAYAIPLAAMESREDVPDGHFARPCRQLTLDSGSVKCLFDIKPEETRAFQQRRKARLDANFAKHLISTAPKYVKNIVSCLRRNEAPKSPLLFHGSTGTGKTKLAEAIATRTNRACFFLHVGTIGDAYAFSELNTIIGFLQKAFSCREPAIIVLDDMEYLTDSRCISRSLIWYWLASYFERYIPGMLRRNSNITLIGVVGNKKRLSKNLQHCFSDVYFDLPGKAEKKAVLKYALARETIQIDDSLLDWAARKLGNVTYRDLEHIAQCTIFTCKNSDLSAEKLFVNEVTPYIPSIWSYFDCDAYSETQSVMIKRYSQVVFTLASGVFAVYAIAKMCMNPV
jgi:DNA replication protein DnaC